MSRHTKGPWDFSWQAQPNGCPTVGHKGLMVCMVAHSAKDPSQKETALANANLIAAAPTMLEALESAREWMAAQDADKSGIEVWVRINKAIARAKGESK